MLLEAGDDVEELKTKLGAFLYQLRIAADVSVIPLVRFVTLRSLFYAPGRSVPLVCTVAVRDVTCRVGRQADSDISAYAVEQTLHMQRRQENEAQERKKLTGSGSKRKSVGSARVQQPYFNTTLYSFM